MAEPVFGDEPPAAALAVPIAERRLVSVEKEPKDWDIKSQAYLNALERGFPAHSAPFHLIKFSKIGENKASVAVSFPLCPGMSYPTRFIFKLNNVQAPFGFGWAYQNEEDRVLSIQPTDKDIIENLKNADEMWKEGLLTIFKAAKDKVEKKGDKFGYYKILKEPAPDSDKESSDTNAETDESDKRLLLRSKFSIVSKTDRTPCFKDAKRNVKPGPPPFELIVDGVNDINRWTDFEAIQTGEKTKNDQPKYIYRPFTCDVMFAVQQAYTAAGKYGVTLVATRIRVTKYGERKKNMGIFDDEEAALDNPSTSISTTSTPASSTSSSSRVASKRVYADEEDAGIDVVNDNGDNDSMKTEEDEPKKKRRNSSNAVADSIPNLERDT